jgi:hypothetical protein
MNKLVRCCRQSRHVASDVLAPTAKWGVKDRLSKTPSAGAINAFYDRVDP